MRTLADALLRFTQRSALSFKSSSTGQMNRTLVKPAQEGGAELLESERGRDHHVQPASLEGLQDDVYDLPRVGAAALVLEESVVGIIDRQ